ncbi:hypothetical protein PDESU_01111 [Pontiella desulfatans]|uniref:Uncharacterized protein n=1 Tax=Pontiella desulfatans TaxID=2750659 RepID=A0A6C2TXV2_PONDE|nr:hypothetical protein [Pontiella desulfatans]VGO12558.1 hypothetical protein PDESU_01111 [Pontiella desulfatans]
MNTNSLCARTGNSPVVNRLVKKIGLEGEVPSEPPVEGRTLSAQAHGVRPSSKASQAMGWPHN